MKNNIAHFRCECHSEGIVVRKDELGLYEFGFVAYHMQSSKLTWKNRLRTIWQLIRKGTYYTDMVILDKKRVKELVKFLKET
jgi:hypothetical protein